MNIRLPAVALSATLVAVLGLAPAFGQTSDITVTTDMTSYGSGDTVMVSGNVGDILGVNEVTLRLLSPINNVVQVAQLGVEPDGSYGTEITAGGPLWTTPGMYTVWAQYSGKTAETTFEFGGTGGSSIPPPPPPGDSERVSIAGVDYNIGYSITGGSIASIIADVEARSLIIMIDSTGDGELTITLPREVIDAKLGGQDDEFNVLVDEEPTVADETRTTDEFRTLVIPFSNGSTQIDIIGTFVVPEFGTIALVVLAAAIVSIVAVSARSRLSIMPRI